MSIAALMDVATAQEMAGLSARIQSAAGTAVIFGPFMEVIMMRRLGGHEPGARNFVVSSALCVAQLLWQLVALPETLKPGKRKTMQEFFGALSSVNPFAFTKVFRASGRSQQAKNLRNLMLITSLQSCTEGRCSSEVFQMWSRNNMKATAGQIRNLLMYWGAVVTGFGLWGSPILLRKMSARAYTTFTNLATTAGFLVHGW